MLKCGQRWELGSGKGIDIIEVPSEMRYGVRNRDMVEVLSGMKVRVRNRDRVDAQSELASRV